MARYFIFSFAPGRYATAATKLDKDEFEKAKSFSLHQSPRSAVLEAKEGFRPTTWLFLQLDEPPMNGDGFTEISGHELENLCCLKSNQ